MLLLIQKSHGQEIPDSLQGRLKVLQQEADCVKAVLQYAQALLEKRDTQYYELALSEAEEHLKVTGDTLGLARFFYERGMLAYYGGDHETSETFADAAIEQASAAGDTVLLGKAFGLKGVFSYLDRDHNQAIHYWSNATRCFESQGATGEAARYYSNIGAIYLDKGYFHSAFRFFDKTTTVLKDSIRLRDAFQMAQINKAVALLRMGALEQSAAVLKDIALSEANSNVRTLVHLNLLQVYAKLEQREAFYRHLDSFELYQDQNRQYGSRLLTAKANAFISFREWEKARAILEDFKAEAIVEDSLVKVPNLNVFYLYYKKTGENLLPEAITDKILDRIADQSDLIMTHRAWQIKALAAAGREDYQAAYQYTITADSIYHISEDSTDVRKLMDMGVLYQTETLKKEKAALGSSLQKAGYTITGLFILFIAVIAMLILVYLNYRKARKLAAQQREIAAFQAIQVEEKLQAQQRDVEQREREMQKNATLLLYARQVETRMVRLLQKAAKSLSQEDRKEVEEIRRNMDQFQATHLNFSIEQELNRQMASFMEFIEEKYPELTASERQVCVLIYLGYSNSEITQILDRSLKSVENFRYRARKKMEVENQIDFTTFLTQLVRGQQL